MSSPRSNTKKRIITKSMLKNTSLAALSMMRNDTAETRANAIAYFIKELPELFTEGTKLTQAKMNEAVELYKTDNPAKLETLMFSNFDFIRMFPILCAKTSLELYNMMLGYAVSEDSPSIQFDSVPSRSSEFKVQNSHASIQNALGEAPSALALAEKKLTKEDEFLKNCSLYTKQYLQLFVGKKSHTAKVEEMKLTSEEFETLEDAGCCDPISYEIMNRPVTVHEITYDLNTVLQFNGSDPSRNKFNPTEVTPSRKTMEKFEEAIKKIQKARQVENSKVVNCAPGGPNFS